MLFFHFMLVKAEGQGWAPSLAQGDSNMDSAGAGASGQADGPLQVQATVLDRASV